MFKELIESITPKEQKVLDAFDRAVYARISMDASSASEDECIDAIRGIETTFMTDLQRLTRVQNIRQSAKKAGVYA